MRRRGKKLSAYIERVGDCWIWTGSRDAKGYGRLARYNVKYRAHVYVYLARFGSIPEGMVLDHLCDTPACVNPYHLVPTTAAKNCRRGKNAKLTMEKARDIRSRVAGGATRRSVAALYGVTEAAVRLIVNGKRWGEVDKPHMTHWIGTQRGRPRLAGRRAVRIQDGRAMYECTHCHEWKFAEDFHPMNGHPKSVCRLSSWCRRCENKARVERKRQARAYAGSKTKSHG